MEIVRPGTGDPVPAGEVGEVVVTTFNRDYPMIRFATGDLSAVLPGRARAGAPTCASRAGSAAPTRPPRSRACSCIPSRWPRWPSAMPASAACASWSARAGEQDTMTLRAESADRRRRPQGQARRDAAGRHQAQGRGGAGRPGLAAQRRQGHRRRAHLQPVARPTAAPDLRLPRSLRLARKIASGRRAKNVEYWRPQKKYPKGGEPMLRKLPLLLATIGAVDRGPGACARRDAQARRHPQLRHHRRDLELRLPWLADLRAAASDHPVLLAARQVRRHRELADHRRPRQELDHLARRPHLHLQAARGRQIPRRLAADLGRRQGHLRAHRQPAARA